MAKVTAPQAPVSPKHPGRTGNDTHMPNVDLKAPLGDKTMGTPGHPGPAPASWAPQSSPAHRVESAHSSLLPAQMVHSGESSE